ncbi:MAG: BBP7 family outer membrane beta-barrel protein [Pirellulales bacterium]
MTIVVSTSVLAAPPWSVQPDPRAPQHRWAQQSAPRLGFTPAHEKAAAANASAGNASAGNANYVPRSTARSEVVGASYQVPAGPSAATPSPLATGDPTAAPAPPADLREAIPADSLVDPSVAVDGGLGSDWFEPEGGCDCPECQGTWGPSVGCRYKWWVKTNYLLWWTKGAESPAILTTSSDTTNASTAGVLGDPDTTVLYGDEKLFGQSRSGMELELGMRLGPLNDRTLQVRYLFIGEDSNPFATSSDKQAVLARPFFDIRTGAQAASLIAFPNRADGNISIDATNSFSMLDAVGDNVVFTSGDYVHHWAIGYRGGWLTDELQVDQNVIARGTGSGLANGTTLATTDLIRTENEFAGVLFGYSTDICRGPWVLRLRTRSALGNSSVDASLAGQTVTTVPGGTPTTTPNGVLVQPTNAGDFTDDRFAVMPEFGLEFYCDIRPGVRLQFGYSTVYWSNVLRAVEQIDTSLNQTQLPPGPLTGPPAPQFEFNYTDFWAQGAHIGCELQW